MPLALLRRHANFRVVKCLRKEAKGKEEMMHPERRKISLGFTGERFSEGLHICYIFRDESERRRVMAQYLKSGLESGEKVLYLVDTMSPGDFLESMEEMGIHPPNRGKDFIVSEALPVYCPDGHFSTPDMLNVVGEFYQDALKEGYTGARGTGEMSWALVEGSVRKQDLMEYEARLNQVLKVFPYTTCCQYDARRFDGGVIMDVLSVHPMMIVRGQVVRNPYYIAPELFLDELRERDTRG